MPNQIEDGFHRPGYDDIRTRTRTRGEHKLEHFRAAELLSIVDKAKEFSILAGDNTGSPKLNHEFAEIINVLSHPKKMESMFSEALDESKAHTLAHNLLGSMYMHNAKELEEIEHELNFPFNSRTFEQDELRLRLDIEKRLKNTFGFQLITLAMAVRLAATELDQKGLLGTNGKERVESIVTIVEKKLEDFLGIFFEDLDSHTELVLTFIHRLEEAGVLSMSDDSWLADRRSWHFSEDLWEQLKKPGPDFNTILDTF